MRKCGGKVEKKEEVGRKVGINGGNVEEMSGKVGKMEEKVERIEEMGGKGVENGRNVEEMERKVEIKRKWSGSEVKVE